MILPTQTNQIGPFQIREEIRRDTFSETYRAWDTSKNRVVALRILNANLARDPIYARHFLMVGQELAHLHHEHIGQVYEAGECEGYAYIAAELIPGQTLLTLLVRQPRLLSVAEATALLQQIAAGLDYAAQHGLLHPELSFRDIWITESGRALLTELGMRELRQATAQASAADESGSGLSLSPFASPEQAQGQAKLDQRADVYSLGVIAYTLLVGKLPFEATDASILRRQIIEQDVPDPTVVNPTIPAHLASSLRKALAKNPAQRYPSAMEFADVLTRSSLWEAEQAERAGLSAASTSALAANQPRARRGLVFAVVALALLVVVGLVLGTFYTRPALFNQLAALGFTAGSSTTLTATQTITTPLQPVVFATATPTSNNNTATTPGSATALGTSRPVVTSTAIALVQSQVSLTTTAIGATLPTTPTRPLTTAQSPTVLATSTVLPVMAPSTAAASATPTATATATQPPTPSATSTATPVPTITAKPVDTPTPIATVTTLPTATAKLALVATTTKANTTAAETAAVQSANVNVQSPVSITATLVSIITMTAPATGTATNTPTNTLAPTATATPTATSTPTASATATITPTDTARPTPTATVTTLPTATATATLTPTATATSQPTATATRKPTATATYTPDPTATSTATNTALPTNTPTAKPTATDTVAPTDTLTPTATASAMATVTPTATDTPVSTDTATATNTVTDTPTDTPTLTDTATLTPTATATALPTVTPTLRPTATATPTSVPTATPTATPTLVAPSFDAAALRSPLTNGIAHIQGFGQPGSRVQVLIDDVVASSVTVKANRTWALAVGMDNPGSYKLSVRALYTNGKVVQSTTPAVTIVVPEPAPTLPSPTPTITTGQVHLVAPGNGTAGSGVEPFQWASTFTLAPGTAFELVFWKAGQDPLVNGFGLAAPTGNSKVSVDLNALDTKLGHLFEPGDYEWGVLLVHISPYTRIQLVSETRTFRFDRASHNSGSNPGGGQKSGE